MDDVASFIASIPVNVVGNSKMPFKMVQRSIDVASLLRMTAFLMTYAKCSQLAQALLKGTPIEKIQADSILFGIKCTR